MDVEQLQDAILYDEVNWLVRTGARFADLEKTPILRHLLLPVLKGASGVEELVSLLTDAVDKLPADERRPASILLGLEGGKQQLKAEIRVAQAAAVVDKKYENFRRFHRKPIIEKVTRSLGDLLPWIDRELAFRAGAHEERAIIPFDPEVQQRLRRASAGAYDFLLRAPDRLRLDYRYEATLELHGQGPHTVNSSYANTRVLPSTDRVSVHICRTHDAFRTALNDPSLIAVELARLDEDAWQALADDFHVQALVGGAKPRGAVRKEVGDDVVVFRYHHSPSTRLEAVQVSATYQVSGELKTFPLRLASHFTVGGPRIRFELVAPDITSLECSDYFTAFDGGRPVAGIDVARKLTTPKARSSVTTVELSPSAVIWPGSGAEFAWTLATDAPARGQRAVPAARKRRGQDPSSSATWRCGMYDYAPLSCISRPDDEYGGPWRLLAEGLSHRLGIELQFERTRMSHLFTEPDGPDMIIGMFDTPARREHMAFSIPFQQVGLQGLCPAALDGDVREQLLQGQLKAAVYIGEVGWEYARREFKDTYRDTVMEFDNSPQTGLGEILPTGRVIVMDELSCATLLQQDEVRGRFKLAFDKPLMKYDVCVAVRKERAAWLPEINEAIRLVRSTPAFLAAETQALTGLEGLVGRLGRVADFVRAEVD